MAEELECADLVIENPATTPASLHPYVLGYAYACVNFEKDSLQFFAVDADRLPSLRDVRCYLLNFSEHKEGDSVPIMTHTSTRNQEFYTLTIKSKAIKDIFEAEGLFAKEPIFTDFQRRFVASNNKDLYPAEFWRGYIESCAVVNTETAEVIVPAVRTIEDLSYLGVPPDTVTENGTQIFRGFNALDFLGIFYKNPPYKVMMGATLFREYYISMIKAAHSPTTCAKIQVQRLSDYAIVPFKNYPSQATSNLSVTHLQRSHGNVEYYGTGLTLTPPFGFQIEIVAHPDLCRSGYMLGTGTLVLQPTHMGEVVIPLVRFDSHAPSIQVPFVACQIVVRRQEAGVMFELVQ